MAQSRPFRPGGQLPIAKFRAHFYQISFDEPRKIVCPTLRAFGKAGAHQGQVCSVGKSFWMC